MAPMTIKIPRDPPCDRCPARCCRRQTSDWPFAVELVDEDGATFAEFATWDKAVGAMVIPYAADGRCPYLTDANLCRVHAAKPQSCRAFACTSGHLVFLSRNPELVELLEQSRR